MKIEKNYKIIDIFGKIDHELFLAIRSQLTEIGKSHNQQYPDIIITITSNGGYVAPGLKIYDLLKFYPGRKIGLVIGNADSTAGTILQGCNLRLSLPHSEFRFHSAAVHEVRNEELDDDKRMAQHRAKTAESTAEIVKTFASHPKMNLSPEKIKKHLLKNKVINAKKALEKGFIDKVVDSIDAVHKLIEKK